MKTFQVLALAVVATFFAACSLPQMPPPPDYSARAHAPADINPKRDIKIEASADDIRSREEEENAPPGIERKACRAKDSISYFQKAMKSEREVGKVSGYVSMGKLHEYGQLIVMNRREIESLKPIYKNKTGRELKLTNCREVLKDEPPLQ